MSVPAPLIFGTQVDPVSSVVSTANLMRDTGPFVGSNGAWYWILVQINNGTNSTQFTAWKSIDRGATRTLIATSANISPQTDELKQNAYYRGSGDVVDMVYRYGGGTSNLFTMTFNMSSESFTSPSDTGVAFTSPSSPENWLIVVNENGDQVVAYDRNTSFTTGNAFIVVKHLGVWSAPVLISGALVNAVVEQIGVDGSGHVGVVVGDINTAAGIALSTFQPVRNAFYWVRLTGATVASTTTALPNAGGANASAPPYVPTYGFTDAFNQANLFPPIYDLKTDSIVIPMFKNTWATIPGPLPSAQTQEIGLVIGTPSIAPVWSYVTVAGPISASAAEWSMPVITAKMDGSEYSVLFSTFDTGPLIFFARATATSLTGPWTVNMLWYDEVANPPTPPGDFEPDRLFFFWARYVDAQQLFSVTTGFKYIIAPSGYTAQMGAFFVPAPAPVIVVPTLSAGGRGFVRVVLNHFDSCLGREYLLYKLIDRELLKCGVKPFCFCFDERDWGGNFSEHEEVPMGPPEGAIAFNPTGAIPLPTIVSGDNVVFQSRVPIGYDGVILGQYHGYITVPTAFPVPIFVEGSGDLIWRLECAGRFMRDCGLMEVSIGTLQNMSPIAGGLQVRSGDLIRYVVAAPNVTGALTAGVGNIVAGLHGYFWPRH